MFILGQIESCLSLSLLTLARLSAASETESQDFGWENKLKADKQDSGDEEITAKVNGSLKVT